MIYWKCVSVKTNFICEKIPCSFRIPHYVWPYFVLLGCRLDIEKSVSSFCFHFSHASRPSIRHFLVLHLYRCVHLTDLSLFRRDFNLSFLSLSSRNGKDRCWEPAVLIEGVLFRARYLGSTQLVCEGQPTKSTRMMQAEEAVSRIKVSIPLYLRNEMRFTRDVISHPWVAKVFPS